MLGYLYFRVAGEAYALVSIGLISFAAVAQFAPALLGGIYWRGGTRAGAFGGLLAGFAVWAWTLMLPSVAKSGWIPAGFIDDGPFGIALLAPERLFGLTGLDKLTHSLFWSLFAQRRPLRRPLPRPQPLGPRGEPGAPLRRRLPPRRRRARLLARPRPPRRPHARSPAASSAPPAPSALFDEHAAEIGVPVPDLVADARLVDRVERQIAGAVGTASARVMVERSPRRSRSRVDDVLEILDEASQLRGYARALEEAHSRRAPRRQRAAAEPRPPQGRLHVLGHPRAAHARSPRSAPSPSSCSTPPTWSPPSARSSSRIIVSESERLTRLVNQVLDLAKIESGHAEWHTDRRGHARARHRRGARHLRALPRARRRGRPRPRPRRCRSSAPTPTA